VARKKHPSDSGSSDIPSQPELQRLTRVVALLLVKGEPQPEKIRTLSAAGFSATEIASLLDVKPNTVSVALHRLRKANH
jgi:DNA-directed RNA polymerase specialized sigma24 family protein